MAKWLKRLSILSLLGFPLAVIGYRLNILDVEGALGVVFFTCILLALIVFIVSLVLSYLHRSDRPNSAKTARTAALLSLIPLIGLGSQIFAARDLPLINDITTDTAKPPIFVNAVGLRNESDNSTDYRTEFAAKQLKAYPALNSIQSELNQQQAMERAKQVAIDLDWEITDVNTNTIEAVETSTLWGYKDDIVVRVTPNGQHTTIDLRSSSRLGFGDFGVNAKRINKFIAEF